MWSLASVRRKTNYEVKQTLTDSCCRWHINFFYIQSNCACVIAQTAAANFNHFEIFSFDFNERELSSKSDYKPSWSVTVRR